MLIDVLFELGTEELPSGAVLPLAIELHAHILAGLDKHELRYVAENPARTYATPRRLAVRFQVEPMQRDQAIVRRGPAYAAGMSAAGVPTPALLGFARSCGVDVAELKTVDTEKGPWWAYEAVIPGRPTRELLPGIIQDAVAALTIAKPMRWGSGDASFVRPVHWAILLLDQDVVEMDILGCRTGRTTIGHRFHHPQAISIESPDTYEQVLEKAYVVADFQARQDKIKHDIQAIAATVGAVADIPDDLLKEVTSIVEWPHVLLANFDRAFLDVPAEALVASMQVHQKCFALYDKQGALLPHFIAVSNIKSLDPARVIAGNERVMHARLSDAAFFYRQDKKQSLQDYALLTANVVFQAKLGTLQDKAHRIEALMVHCAPMWNLNLDEARRAAQLCKADLMTAMVGEFPELQGVMGCYYAQNDGESPAVAQALTEQYLPRFAADDLPKTSLGRVLSLADRLDTLAGAFALGLKPTGVKDPFKLRRHALAVIRLLRLESINPLSLLDLLGQALNGYQSQLAVPAGTLEELQRFILDRMPASYQNTGVDADVILAVRARQQDDLYDMDQRINALQAFLSRPEVAALAAACKRVDHLLQHLTFDHTVREVDVLCFEKDAEKHLFVSIQKLEHDVAIHAAAKHYDQVLKELASLREPVDLFFEQVMVMVEDETVKNNRLCLIARLQTLLRSVADFSLIAN